MHALDYLRLPERQKQIIYRKPLLVFCKGKWVAFFKFYVSSGRTPQAAYNGLKAFAEVAEYIK